MDQLTSQFGTLGFIDDGIAAVAVSQRVESLISFLNVQGLAPASIDFLKALLELDRLLINILCEIAASTEIDKTASSVISISEFIGESLDIVGHAIAVEVERTNEPTTQFRGSTIASKLMYCYARRVGEQYLVKTIKPCIERICMSNQSFEIDPVKLKPTDNREENLKALLQSAEEFWSAIVSSTQNLPIQLKVICSHLRQNIVKKFPDYANQAVAGFFFLRFINPAIVTPERIVNRDIIPQTRRNLVLISKILQNLANGVEFQDKEDYMKPANPFIIQKMTEISTFLQSISNVPAHVVSKYKRTSTMIEIGPVAQEELVTAINFLFKQTSLEQMKVLPLIAQRMQVGGSFTPQMLEDLVHSVHILGTGPVIPESISVEKIQQSDNQEKLYQEYLEKSRNQNFINISTMNIIYIAGYDNQKRPIVCCIPEKLNGQDIQMDKLLLYIIHLLDPIVVNDYILVYIHGNLDSEHSPNFSWLKTAYTIFNRKYKKNLKELYVVRPSRWLKVIVACFRPFLSTKFWRKMIYINELMSWQHKYHNGM